ncbi:MAG TPA: type II toxin-antitoxin system RelE/ParE family toxin [Gemmatimonadaceae bacterium]
MRVTWSALAEKRALEAVDYIAQDRPQAAAAWLEELLERVARLDRFARRGRVVPEIGRSTVREIWHAPYRVIYRVDASRVVILTTSSLSRDNVHMETK